MIQREICEHFLYDKSWHGNFKTHHTMFSKCLRRRKDCCKIRLLREFLTQCYIRFLWLILLLSSLQDDPRAREALMASTASAVTSAASTNMTSNEQPTATLAKSSSILQELCSRPKNYGANPTTTGGTASMEMAATASSEAEKQPLQSPAAPVATVLPQPESPGLKMKIKRSNSTNSKDSAEDKNETESRPKKSSNSKRKKDMAAAPTSSSSTSSSRSSSPRYDELKQTYQSTYFNPCFH